MPRIRREKDLGKVEAHHPVALPDLSQSQGPGMLELTLAVEQGRGAGRGSAGRALSSHMVITYCN